MLSAGIVKLIWNGRLYRTFSPSGSLMVKELPSEVHVVDGSPSIRFCGFVPAPDIICEASVNHCVFSTCDCAESDSEATIVSNAVEAKRCNSCFIVAYKRHIHGVLRVRKIVLS